MIMSVMPFATVASSNINTPQGWQPAVSAHCNHALQDLTQFTVIYCGVTHCCILIFDWFICHISSCKSPRSWQLSYIILDNCVRYIPSCLTMIWDHKHVFFCTGCAFAVYLPHLELDLGACDMCLAFVFYCYFPLTCKLSIYNMVVLLWWAF